MRYRCPYCRRTIDGPLRALCPHCRHTMNVAPCVSAAERRARRRSRERARRQAGFERRALRPPPAQALRHPSVLATLVAVLAVLTGLIGLRTRQNLRGGVPGRSPAERADGELRVLAIALERFRLDCERYPSESEALRALLDDPGAPGWNGPYVTHLKPDPWRTPYGYRPGAAGPDVWSCGPDRQPGTADDRRPPAAAP